MKHAGAQALDQLEPLLVDLRSIDGLVERSRGVFYKRSRAFLHFHEDPSGMHADVRSAGSDDFERYRVDTPAEREAFLALVRAAAS